MPAPSVALHLRPSGIPPYSGGLLIVRLDQENGEPTEHHR